MRHLPSRTRARRSAVALGALLALTACGGGGGGGGPAATPPTITGLSYSPGGAYVGAGDGRQAIDGQLTFTDAGGDLASLTLTVLDAQGTVVDAVTSPVQGAGGHTSGTVSAQVVVATGTVGTYTLKVVASDAAGARSNELSGTFRIAAFPWVAKSAMPAPRHHFATAVLGGRIFVIGGDDPAAGVIPAPAVARVDVYDPATDTWSTGPALPVERMDAVAAEVGGRIYLAGGRGLYDPMVATLFVYDPTADVWSAGAAMPYALTDSAGAAANGHLWVFGGSSGGMDTANALEYDAAMDAWVARAPVPRAGSGSRAAAVNGQPVLVGGYASTWVPDAGYFRQLAGFDPVANAWTARSDLVVPVARAGVAAIGGTLYAVGGQNWDRALDVVAAWNAASDRWSAKTPMPGGLAWPRAEAVGGKLYVFDGGTTLEYTPENDLL
jgi:hypothetical protein